MEHDLSGGQVASQVTPVRVLVNFIFFQLFFFWIFVPFFFVENLKVYFIFKVATAWMEKPIPCQHDVESNPCSECESSGLLCRVLNLTQ